MEFNRRTVLDKQKETEENVFGEKEKRGGGTRENFKKAENNMKFF